MANSVPPLTPDEWPDPFTGEPLDIRKLYDASVSRGSRVIDLEREVARLWDALQRWSELAERLGEAQGERDAARAILVRVVGHFTGGVTSLHGDGPILRDARRLLEATQ